MEKSRRGTGILSTWAEYDREKKRDAAALHNAAGTAGDPRTNHAAQQDRITKIIATPLVIAVRI